MRPAPPRPSDFRHPAAAAVVGDIETFVRQALANLEAEPATAGAPRAGRPRILPTLLVWGALLVCVLQGFTRYRALWRLLRFYGLWEYPRIPVSDQAVYDRLATAGTAPLEQVFGQVRDVLAARVAPAALPNLAPFATEVVAIDATGLDRVARRLPALSAPPPSARRLPGKLAASFDVRRQQWRTVQHLADPHQNDTVSAAAVCADLPTGSLLLFDLGYFSFRWFDDLTAQGQWWVCRLREKTSYEVVHTFYADPDRGRLVFDGVVWLGVHRADRAAYAVRLVRLRLGTVTYQYLTNVLDPHRLSLQDIAGLYLRRWDIERAFDLIKTRLGLHLLWATRDTLVLQQVWAVLIISQIVQALRMEIAARAGVDPFEVSLAGLVEHLPRLAARGEDPVTALVERGRQVELIRPSRRTVNRAPAIPPARLRPLPAALVLVRTPRYAQRRCAPGPRPSHHHIAKPPE